MSCQNVTKMLKTATTHKDTVTVQHDKNTNKETTNLREFVKYKKKIILLIVLIQWIAVVSSSRFEGPLSRTEPSPLRSLSHWSSST